MTSNGVQCVSYDKHALLMISIGVQLIRFEFLTINIVMQCQMAYDKNSSSMHWN